MTVAGEPATGVTVVSKTKVTALTPATPTVIGPVLVTVANAYGTAASSTTLFGLYGPFGFGTPIVTDTGAVAPDRIAVGDVDGDGKDDRIYQLGPEIWIERHGTSSGFGASSTYLGCAGPGPIVTGDLDGDTLADIFIVCGTSIHLLKGVANAAAAYLSTISIGVTIQELVTADVDGDAFADLALSATDATSVVVFSGDGTGLFTAGAVIDFTDVVGYLTAGDVSGDGKDDIVTGNYVAKKLRVAINSGTATFATPVATGVNGLQTVAIGRIDDDTRGDILVSSVDAAVSASYFSSLGDGSLGPRVALTSGGLYGATPGDFNGDGINDVLVSGGTGFRIFPGNGDGTFTCVMETTRQNEDSVSVARFLRRSRGGAPPRTFAPRLASCQSSSGVAGAHPVAMKPVFHRKWLIARLRHFF